MGGEQAGGGGGDGGDGGVERGGGKRQRNIRCNLLFSPLESMVCRLFIFCSCFLLTPHG